MGLDDIPGEILKLGREAIIPYLARLLDINLQIIQTIQAGKPWGSVRRYFAFAPCFKRTLENGHGNL
jgi:hypothetical protein